MKYNWKPVVKSLLKVLQDHNFKLVRVDDGGDEDEVLSQDQKKAAKEALDIMTGVDESTLIVSHPSVEKKMVVFVVLGNEPWETVCDYSSVDILDIAVDQFSKKWEDKSCPTFKD